MATKLIIKGEAGKAINGRDCVIEVNGEMMHGQMSLDANFPIGEVATVTVTMILPKIEYRPE